MKSSKKVLREIYRKRINYFFILPFAIVFFVFTVLPVCFSIFLGFCQYNVLQPMEFVGIDNYVRLFFEDDIFIKVLMNTVVMAAATGPVGYILSFLLVWLINELNL